MVIQKDANNLKGSRAVYQEVAVILAARIRSGEWSHGATLPSCQTLATQYNVAVGTVHQAIKSLAADGMVQSVPGRGTFVAGDGIEQKPLPAASGQITSPALRVAVVAGIRPASVRHRTGHTMQGVQSSVAAIERSCGQLGGSIAFYGRQLAGDDWEPFEESIKRIDWSKTDAVILVGIHQNLETADDIVRAAEKISTPLVCMVAGELPSIVPHVFYDNRFGGYEAARHLISQGFEKFTFVSPFRSSWSRERMIGARQAVEQYGLPEEALTVYPSPRSIPSVDDLGYVSAEFTIEATYRNSLTMLTETEPPTAVIAASDPVASGYIQAARERGLEPGSDYAITGFDNIEEARENGLTTFQPPWEAMAEEAVRLLFAQARRQHVGTQIRVRPHLVPRASTATSFSALRRNTISVSAG